MNQNRELTFEEQRLLQLDILHEVDLVCKRESIKYSLAFGTLLGAIRHKGYIPWDDDLDIMMPYTDMLRLREALRNPDVRFYDIDTSKYYGNPFGNICSEKTYRLIGKKKERGLGIDVYPIVKLPSTQEGVDVFFDSAEHLQSKRLRALSIRQFMLRHFSFCPPIGFKKRIKNFRDHLVSYNTFESSYYYIIAGPLSLRKKMIYDEDLFKNMIEVDFEGRKYPSIALYDKFLTMRYGNYMQLPPEDQRHPYHGQRYYWE